MIHLPRRYFFQAIHEKHYKKRGTAKGGPINLDSTLWVSKDTVQDSIDGLNAAIDRLDKIINEMKAMGEKDGNNK